MPSRSVAGVAPGPSGHPLLTAELPEHGPSRRLTRALGVHLHVYARNLHAHAPRLHKKHARTDVHPHAARGWHPSHRPVPILHGHACSSLRPPSSRASLSSLSSAAPPRALTARPGCDVVQGRVFEVSLADLNNDEDQYFRKMKLVCEEIQGTTCLTNFHG